MKKYKEYMDNVRASDTLHQRLLNLGEPQKRPAPWKKYGTVAAALVLVVGLGAWGLGKSGGWNALIENFRPGAAPHYPSGYQGTEPETADEPVPDIALVEPGDVIEPGMKTIGGYEVASSSGENAMTSYYVLPYIEYGESSGVSGDFSLAPPDGGLRGATRDDALALVGGEDALTAHLNWGGCKFDGTVGFEADGTVWMMSLWGENEDTAFSLELSPNRMPPTCCVVMGEQRTITNVWGVEVSGVKTGGAYGDTERGIYMDVCREVEFIANGVGCRLRAYGTQDGAVEELVSRFVRWAVLEGLDLSGISPDGAMPQEIDPNYSVGEPNWNDSGETPVPEFVPDYDPTYEDGVPGYDSSCPYCADGAIHTHPYDPAGPVSVSDAPAASEEICGYPLAPDTETCPTCGEAVPEGMAHDCAAAHICEVCGQTLPAGMEHSHQEDHHQDHHSSHH